jgi:NAD(P)-dependent dehydrogenase (short-subunit alcohol dehydrogenase family)
MASEAELEETAALVEKTGRRALLRKADVRDYDALQAVVDEGLAAFGHIDIVCANAGIAIMGPATTPEAVKAAWDDVIGTNLTGVWNTVRAAAPSMMERNQGGSIIITSSTAGLKPMASPGNIGSESYGTAKHGLVGLMRQFAVELSGHSIRVNTIHPTGVNTMMTNNEAIQAFLQNLPEEMKSIAAMQNLLPVEMLEPEDISDAVVFLASDQAKYITGVTLPVDAGFTVK